jgi:hypothetical protein
MEEKIKPTKLWKKKNNEKNKIRETNKQIFTRWKSSMKRKQIFIKRKYIQKIKTE